MALQGMKHRSGMVKDLRGIRVLRERQLEQPEGLAEPTLLRAKQTEMVETTGMVAIRLQDRVIEPLGLGQLAVLMQRNGLLKNLREVALFLNHPDTSKPSDSFSRLDQRINGSSMPDQRAWQIPVTPASPRTPDRVELSPLLPLTWVICRSGRKA
jgi:hypothetical protein